MDVNLNASEQIETQIDDAIGAVVEAPATVPAPRALQSDRRKIVRDLPHVMTRIFGTPLLIDAAKLDVILAALGPRLNLILSPMLVKADADFDLSNQKPGAIAGDASQMRIGFADDDSDDDECPYDVTQDGIALMYVNGTLVYKTSWLGALSGMTSYASIEDCAMQAAADPSVKGILLHVGSNGGEANGCFDTSDAIFALRSQKPIYGVATDNAFSGGYALLSAASKVFVSRTSGVGSIGVCCLHVDQSNADKMDGLKYTYVYSGDRKIDGNPHAPLTAEARDVLQADCDRVRQLFAASVAKYRGLSVDAVLGTQASLFFGENAVAAKLADAIGTPGDALAALRADIAAQSAGGVLRIEAAPTPAQVEAPAQIAEVAVDRIAAVAPGNVVNIDSVRSAAGADAAALHVEIIELCALADAPELAAGFIRNRIGLADVREQLQLHRAKASNSRPISGHILPDAGDNHAQTVAAGWAKAAAAARGSLKGK